ncbi:hypothetical protein BJ123_13115 [Rhodopseudomonas thermotolerans]|uniref:AAA+ ATPase domain-containing protein n=2 Tax=Rhodopseudomonas TaxID=1073 RepID=A0A336JXY1_9BRAD|nr:MULTISPECIES: hypothetical protein [Rhodopseudomonas]RED25547.1 hypothetical protein BJ125_13115 [Rhodopseudomonas pentothenatexigens]REF90377.1 hypothetical protein BJ123_13115 [Rhodopseudomonas thermotolerans]SSW93159.1 hypothetical protein SAMN05892882_13115 [Rhodopseudomonas pentothenatexigens]
MAYSFENLSHADFEDLARDLLGQETGVRFEGFSAGPDGGIDGRHATADKLTILQAKHYAGSPFSALKSAMAKSRPCIDVLKPSRYLLATSRALTPANKASLAREIGPWLQSQADIFGPTEINDLLRKFPEIAKANLKLWLSGTAVLERIVHAAAHAFTVVTREEIESKLKVYAPNPSFTAARDKLEQGHVVIISGPPGVGKTTLAEMLSYAYISDGWTYVAIRSLNDGFAKLDDRTKQIFFFDDFLGTAALDTRALASNDSDLTRFLKRVRASSNARFVLTTRAPIFEEARRISEHLADQRLDIAKYVLDVGVYTRRIRARILYNHLAISGVSQEHIVALWQSHAVPLIVDHKNYNPRIIEAMTDGPQMRDVTPASYGAEFLKALDNPSRIWDVSFRKHIPEMCRHLLYALFFCSDYGVSLDELRVAFDALHQLLASKYSTPHGPKDFEEAVRILEGGYININGKTVTFINPSLRDFLTDYIDSPELVEDLAEAAQKADWSKRVSDHIKAKRLWRETSCKRGYTAFISVARRFTILPEMKKNEDREGVWSYYDLSFGGRIELLLEWSKESDNAVFVQIATEIAANPSRRFDAWRDGQRLVSLIIRLQDGAEYGSLKGAEKLRTAIEDQLVTMLNGYIVPDDLDSILDSMEGYEQVLGDRVRTALSDAMRAQFERLDSLIEDVDNESTLDDHIKAIRRFAPLVGVKDDVLVRAVATIELKKSEIEEVSSAAESPTFPASIRRESDKFDDQALEDLFAPLVYGLR